MSAKYSKLPMSDPGESATIDFGSIFEYPKYFSYSNSDVGPSMQQYKSMFTYSGDNPHSKGDPLQRETPSIFVKCCGILITVLCYILVGITLPVSAWFTFKMIPQHERLVIIRLGRLLTTKGPGLVVLLPCIDKWYKVDLRTRAFSVPPIKALTGDGATIEIGADVYFHIFEPLLSVTNVQDLDHSTRLICQTLLQRHLSRYNLSDVEMSRVAIVDALQPDINEMTRTWGVKLERIELSQVRVIAEPNPLISQSSNPLSILGPLLFPPGSGNAPVKQLAQHFGLQMPGLVPPDTVELTPQAASIQSGGAAALPKKTKKRFEVETPQELMIAVKPHLNSRLVADFGCTYKFVVQSPDGEEVFYLDLKNDEGSVNSGELPGGADPDVTMTLALEDFGCLISGDISAFAAYMTGRLSVKGDLTCANRLAELVEHIRQQTP